MNINKINLTASNYLPRLLNDLNSFQTSKIESKNPEKDFTAAIKKGETTAAINRDDLVKKYQKNITRIYYA